MSSIKSLEYKGIPVWQRASQKSLRSLPWTPCSWQQQLRNGEALKGITIIDGHAHLGEYAAFLMHKPGALSMVEVMDRIGMKAAILSSNPAISSNPRYGNRVTQEAVRECPGRLYGYVVANPHFAEEMEAELNHYLDQSGFVGIKLHPELHDDYPLRAPRYEPMWAVATERKTPVLFHTYFGGDTLDDLVWVADRYPDVPILVGHMLQDKNMEAMVELANSFENIYVDLTVPEIYGSVEFFVATLDDIEKIIFGTDFPWGNCHFRVGAVIYARISQDEKRKILGQNAAKLFGIST